MRIDVRPVAKLRGENPADVAAALGPVLDALASSSVDLAVVNVMCDWIQYRSNFREPVEIRPVLAERGAESRALATRRWHGRCRRRAV